MFLAGWILSQKCQNGEGTRSLDSNLCSVDLSFLDPLTYLLTYLLTYSSKMGGLILGIWLLTFIWKMVIA